MAAPSVPELGRLEETPLPVLLLELHRSRYTGALALVRGRTGKRVLLSDGAPVSAESNLASESLGVQLMDAGRLSREDYARVTREVERRGCKEGAALLALRLLEPKELFVALKEQLRRRIVECFGWPEGEFQLDPSESPAEDAHPFRTDLVSLVQEGLARHWSADRILGGLMDHCDEFATPPPGDVLEKTARRLESDDAVRDLLASLDGTRTMGQVLAGVRSSPRALAAGWVLHTLGAILYRDTPPGEDSEPEPAPEIEIEVVSRDSAGAGGRARRRPGAADATESGREAVSDPRAEKLRHEITERHAELDSLDHYGALGVDSDASPAAIKKAYFQAAKRYHPDTLNRMGLQDVKEAATEVFARIAEAYEVLADSQRRRSYDAALADDGPEIDVERVAQAEGFYRKGEVLVRMGNFTGALEFLRPAVEIWPEEPVYQAALGWACFKARPSDPEAARTHLERAIEMAPRDALSHQRLGLVLRALGEEDRAARLLAQAKRLDPSLA